jgi:putative ABC transport system substrate-binding protein
LQFDQLKRREFIALLGGAAAAWRSRRARSSGCRWSGCLIRQRRTTTLGSCAKFREGLKEAGYVEGESVADYRWAEKVISRSL